MILFEKANRSKTAKRIVSGIASTALVLAIGSPLKSINAFADETDEYIYKIDMDYTISKDGIYSEKKYCLCFSANVPQYYLENNGEEVPNYYKRILLSEYGGYAFTQNGTETVIEFDDTVRERLLKILVSENDIMNFQESVYSTLEDQWLDLERQWLIENVDGFDQTIILNSDSELQWLITNFKKLYETGIINKNFYWDIPVYKEDENGVQRFEKYIHRKLSDVYEDYYVTQKISKSKFKKDIKTAFGELNKDRDVYNDKQDVISTQRFVWTYMNAIEKGTEWDWSSYRINDSVNKHIYNSFDRTINDKENPYSYWNIVEIPVISYIDSLPNYFDEGWDAWVYIQRPDAWDNQIWEGVKTQSQPALALPLKTGADYISIKKTNENGTRLIGAVLQLIDMNPESPNYQKALRFREENGILIYDENGEIDRWTSEKSPQKIKGVKIGTYEIHEVSAPNTYNKSKGQPLNLFKHTYGDEKHPYSFNITNTKGFVLPETGGIGTKGIVVFGSTILVAGLALGLKRKHDDENKM